MTENPKSSSWKFDCEYRSKEVTAAGELKAYCTIILGRGNVMTECLQDSRIDSQPVDLFEEFYNSIH